MQYPAKEFPCSVLPLSFFSYSRASTISRKRTETSLQRSVFQSQIIIFKTSCKQPPIISDRDHFRAKNWKFFFLPAVSDQLTSD